MSAEKEQVLRELRLPEKLAPLITGETKDEMTDSARLVAKELNIPTAPAEVVMLARRALAHAERVRLYHGVDPSPEPEKPEPDKPEIPDFDGGVRQTAPMPGDPEKEHGETMVKLVRAAQHGLIGGDLDGDL